MVTETRSHARASPVEEEEAKVGSKKKSDSKVEIDTRTKKPKVSTGNGARNKNYKGHMNAKSASDIAAAKFDEFCKAIREHLSVDEMCKILEANSQDASGSNDAVVPRCQDMMFYGPLEKCPRCKGNLVFTGRDYSYKSTHSGWSTCNYSTKESPRKEKAIKFPDGISNTSITDVNNLERNIPIVREAWLRDSIDKQAAQSLKAYDVLVNVGTEDQGFPGKIEILSGDTIESFSSEQCSPPDEKL